VTANPNSKIQQLSPNQQERCSDVSVMFEKKIMPKAYATF